jgi:hypothetical protein
MTRDDRRVGSIRSLLVNGGVLTGLLAIATASVTAQTQHPEPPSFGVPPETVLLVGAIAAVGAYVGVLVAKTLRNRRASTEPQPQQPRSQGRPGQPPREQRDPDQPDGDRTER